MGRVKEDHQLRMENVGCKRGERWLFRHLNLNLKPGLFVAVVGPSGVGKSSLLECLAGMIEPEEGKIIYRDSVGKIETPRQYQDHVGIIFQNLQIVPQETLLNNVLAGALHRLPWWRTLWGFPRKEQESAERILDMLGLEGKIYQSAGQISGGEQQRVALARAIIHEPELYLADEPVANLDAYLTGRVLGYLKQEAKEKGRTVFCVLHHAEHVNRFADLALSLDPLDPSGWQIREIRR
jgi:phosphonate transport system ATP-binding protein